MTLLVIRPGALGDTLLALPALRALRQRFPDARLHLVGHLGAAALLQAAGEIDAFTDFDAPQLASLFSAAGPPAALELLRPLEAVVAWLSDPEGLVRSNLERLAPEQLLLAPSRPPADSGQHLSDYLLATLKPLAPPPPDPRLLVLPRAVSLSPLPVGEGQAEGLLLVHPGSGSPAKNWPPERFAQVVHHLRQHGWTVALVCGPADEAACNSVLAYLEQPLAVLRPASVLELAQALLAARAYLGNDSGVAHLTASLGCPTLALFGPTDPRVWAPRGPKVQVLPVHTTPAEVAETLQRLASARGRPAD